jgi:hypothetical protein
MTSFNMESAMADIVAAQAAQRIVPNPAASRGHIPWVAIAYAVFALLIWYHLPPTKIGESNQLMVWILICMGLPMCIASVRHHHNCLAITVLNVLIFAFFLWTAAMAGGYVTVVILLFVPFYLLGAIGWLVALIWSFTAVRR